MHKGTQKIKTERLVLRKFRRDDAEAIFENWISDPEVSKYMVWNHQTSIDETKKWLKKIIGKYKELDSYNWGIELEKTGDLIGSISANKAEKIDKCYEIGYAIGRKFWRNGYATESLKAVVEFLINEEGIRKFICRYAKDNQVSGSVIRKVGFEYIGRGQFTSIDGKRIFESEEYFLER